MEPEMCFWVPGEAGEGTGTLSGPPSGVQVGGRITQLGDERVRVRLQHTLACTRIHTCMFALHTCTHTTCTMTAARLGYDSEHSTYA
eukprot:3924407-Rhodomonas_salina.1